MSLPTLGVQGSEKLPERRKDKPNLREPHQRLSSIVRQPVSLLFNGFARAVATPFPQTASFIFSRDLNGVLERAVGFKRRTESWKRVEKSH